jgi:hypothetical protein
MISLPEAILDLLGKFGKERKRPASYTYSLRCRPKLSQVPQEYPLTRCFFYVPTPLSRKLLVSFSWGI